MNLRSSIIVLSILWWLQPPERAAGEANERIKRMAEKATRKSSAISSNRTRMSGWQSGRRSIARRGMSCSSSNAFY